jgi:hypothetical protein
MPIFFVNLPKDTQRKEDNFIEDKMNLWEAIHWNTLPEDHEVFKKMVSYWNLPEKDHKAKCGCFISHYRLLKYIVACKLNQVVVLEDDAVGNITDIDPDEYPNDGLTYLGGFFADTKLTNSHQRSYMFSSKNGINIQGDDRKIMMTLSFYIPTWEIAKDIINYIDSQKRYRAIDVMFQKWSGKKYYIYPALFIEGDYPSNLRDKKPKHSDNFYRWK